MHEKRGNFCIFLLKLAEKEAKTGLPLLVISRPLSDSRLLVITVPGWSAGSAGAGVGGMYFGVP
jgi:hypothetical protein